MELLTSQGWNAVYTVEAVIMQVSNLLVNGSARIPQQEKVNVIHNNFESIVLN